MQTKQRLDVPLSLKSVSDSGEFEGYGSVFGVKDSHDDVVMSGAFAASLRAWSDRKALTPISITTNFNTINNHQIIHTSFLLLIRRLHPPVSRTY